MGGRLLCDASRYRGRDPVRRNDAGATSCHFLEDIDEPGVAVRHNDLETLQQNGTPQNYYKNNAITTRVADCKQHAEQEKCTEVFKQHNRARFGRC